MKWNTKFPASFFAAMAFVCLLFISSGVFAQGSISIDTNKKYDGMNTSFSKGYAPSIQKNTMRLVVPFQTDLPLKQEVLLVGVSFEREENSPFYFKNYQKKVKQTKRGIYLYQCRIKLKKDRRNGQYPLHLTVSAQTAEEIIVQEFTIYIEITDGKPAELQEEVLGQEAEEPTEEKTSFPESKNEENIQKPKVMIYENNLNGISAKAGETTPWRLLAKNCSSSQSMENLKVTLLTENPFFTFERTSWYFAQVKAKDTIDLSQNISVGAKAAEGAVLVQILFDYEDKTGESYQVTESVYLAADQIQQAELADLSFPESIYESDTDLLTFQVQNTGLTSLYNVRVRFEGKGLFAQKELFLGNMEAGTSSDGEISVFAGTLNMNEMGEIIDENAEKYGDTSGTVIFSYENELGELTELKREVHTVIQKPQVVELKVEEEEPQTNQWWVTIFVLVIVVLILLVIWLYIRMKYYQRRGSFEKK